MPRDSQWGQPVTHNYCAAAAAALLFAAAPRARAQRLSLVLAYAALPSSSLVLFDFFQCEPFADGRAYLKVGFP